MIKNRFLLHYSSNNFTTHIFYIMEIFLFISGVLQSCFLVLFSFFNYLWKNESFLVRLGGCMIEKIWIPVPGLCISDMWEWTRNCALRFHFLTATGIAASTQLLVVRLKINASAIPSVSQIWSLLQCVACSRYPDKVEETKRAAAWIHRNSLDKHVECQRDRVSEFVSCDSHI